MAWLAFLSGLKRKEAMPVRKTPSASKDDSNYWWTLDPLFFRLGEVLRPLEKSPNSVRILNDLIATQELEKGRHWQKKMTPLIKEVSRETGVPTSDIESVLLRWWNPGELGAIKQLATAMKKGQEIVQREIRLRRTILNTVHDLGYPPLPSHIESNLRNNCELALETLALQQKCYSEAARLIQEAGANSLNARNEKRRKDKAKPRTGKTRTAVIALRRLFSNSVKSDRRQSVLIHQLLSAWNADMAPPTFDSIRTGYR